MNRKLSVLFTAAALTLAVTGMALASARVHGKATTHATKASSTIVASNGVCPPGCTIGSPQCRLSGHSASASKVSAAHSPAMNATSCPFNDASKCPDGCKRANAGAVAAVAAQK